MAELSYNDVQRAVQDALNPLRNDLQRVSTDLEQCLQEVRRINQEVLTTMNQTRPNNAEQRLSSLQAEIHDLRQRFSVIEQFAKQMSDYFRAKFQEDQENARYKKL